jgi:hypothetical protein
MANSGSYTRGGSPRSVPDPDGDAYDEMIRRHKSLAAREGPTPGAGSVSPRSSSSPRPEPVTVLDSSAAAVAKVLNGPREARRQLEQGHPVKALVGGATAAADLAWGGLALKGLLKGHVKLQGPFNWRNPPWKEQGARQWMGEKGIVAKGQHAHHALIPNNRWGKYIPDAIKNQPANIKPMESPLIHTRIHGASRKADLPRFNRVERYWHGTPTWWKAANASATGHLTQAIDDALGGEQDSR